MNRILRVKGTGQWCAPMITDEAFHDDGSAWAESVAATLGLAPGSLEVVDVDGDPRTGPLLEDPNVPPSTPTPAAAAAAQKAALEALATPLVKAVEDVLLARQMAPMTAAEQAKVRDGAVYLASRGQFGKPV